jgi:peptidoglycan glycosyltransferase
VSRRLGILASIILLLFAVVAVQAASIQFFRAAALDKSSINPRVTTASTQFARGEIVAADGTILAQSLAQSSGFYPYRRIYPLGALTSGVVGFSGPSYGDWGLEVQYDSYLTAHAQPPQSFAQLLAPTSAADSITLTLQPKLQQVARKALAGQDGAVVVLDPRTGAVLAMYSNPNYNPTPLTSPSFKVAAAAWKLYTKNNTHGFPPLGLVATQQTFPPGSSFKVITTAAAVIGRQDLLSKSYPSLTQTTLPNTNKTLANFDFGKCGGTVPQMLPPSCDTGYALLGLDLGGQLMSATADAFGYNKVPPLDLPGVVASYFPPASAFQYDLPGLAYSSIGQKNVRASTLLNALVAAAIANGGVMMSPHLLDHITGPDGTIVKRYTPSVWRTPLTPTQALLIVPLMQNVVKYGTLSGVGFPSVLDVAGKTGTAQVGNLAKNTDDWVIAFAPASAPTIAVAVVLPFQPTSQEGASTAGPVAKCMVEGALALQAGLPPSGTATTCSK